jgi:hypothetical protein
MRFKTISTILILMCTVSLLMSGDRYRFNNRVAQMDAVPFVKFAHYNIQPQSDVFLPIQLDPDLFPIVSFWVPR